MNPFASILEEAAERNHLRPSLQLLVDVWPTLVGPELANQARPCAWINGALTVEVNAHWLKQLRATRTLILRKANQNLPFHIDSIEFVEGVIPPRPPTQPAQEPPAPSPADVDLVRELPAEMRDAAAQIAAYLRTRET